MAAEDKLHSFHVGYRQLRRWEQHPSHFSLLPFHVCAVCRTHEKAILKLSVFPSSLLIDCLTVSSSLSSAPHRSSGLVYATPSLKSSKPPRLFFPPLPQHTLTYQKHSLPIHRVTMGPTTAEGVAMKGPAEGPMLLG